MFAKRTMNHSLRSAQALEIPTPKTEFDRNTIRYRATIIWNSLPNEYKSMSDSSNFKRRVRALPLNDFSFKKEACMITFKDKKFTYF